MKLEHITLATGLSILVIVVGAVVFYFQQVNAFSEKTNNLGATIEAEKVARMVSDDALKLEHERMAKYMQVYNRNQNKMCIRLQVDCEIIQP